MLLVVTGTEARAQLQSILQKAQARTLVCAGRRDARDLIPLASAVICERDLPDGSWLDVLQEARGLTPAPPVIVTSRLADARLWLEVLGLGGYDVLAQPFRAEEVVWALNSALGRSAAEVGSGTTQPSAALIGQTPRTYAFR